MTDLIFFTCKKNFQKKKKVLSRNKMCVLLRGW